jgi:hypothetical protein
VTDRITIAPFESFVLWTRTRFPFRYGIASMTDVPHLFMRTRVTAGDRSAVGLTAEGLPPKWFTKNPATTFEEDLPDMLDVIGHAAHAAAHIARTPVSFFELWRAMNREQSVWAAAHAIAPLLANLGVSLVERAVLDGLCRLTGDPVHHLVVHNRLGIRLGEIHSELDGAEPRDLLPPAPLTSCFVRHTVGLGDPITPADISPPDRIADGLPQDLEASIRAYDLRFFKVKLSGASDRDVPRLRALTRVLARETDGDFRVTLDGNENFDDVGAFRDFYERAAADASLEELWRRIVAVEQPVHRDRALGDAAAALRQWPDCPPVIIDESDGRIGDLSRALELGYSGTSHKNCKGIVKGIANACLLAKRRSEGRPGLLTGEDLCTLGPIALCEDLAMMALFGIEHVERNGHHYYRGISMLPEEWQRASVSAHGDLYTRHADGFACLRIENGRLQLGSVNAAPFGVRPVLDVSGFAALEITRSDRIS